MTGIEEVARATGVSTATVSRALRGLPNVSDKTRDAVRRAADELGYVASSSASGLASGRTLALGVVVPSVSRWFYAQVLEGVDAELRAASYDMILFNLGAHRGNRERVFHRSILRKRTDALLALCLDFTPDERKQLASLGHPTIVVGGSVMGLRSIGIDERSTARRATEHLIGLGHTQIAHLGGEDEEGLNSNVPLSRLRGFEQAMTVAGLPVRPEWVVPGGFSLPRARASMSRLLDRPGPRPTAVFASSDEMAIGAILAAGDRGLRVPEDLSVIGIDDHDFAACFGLTTMAQNPFEQGATATRMLLKELGGGEPRTRSVSAAATLVVRSSTAPPH
ncbi:LacI family transcription regulator [Leifsonia xyli subsp. cynodontis DSM 46306]|uniref:HTH lacI-type domain-containing protein n=1 Tax=Leifsonia xyli subsp. cynodontis DSM 46306 TaxID=1389489 RepID=U3PA60_LEIXC|nr:LacI family DNA-binding transcriptional regulator [Leifsonia xyli]AGW42379.1 LacI family transcription regulator [Leifsonia xyli subsp. cynodontis DSM 46306]